ncbi:MAG: hypothetical protein LW860_18610 [Xanthomonadaceae bacterium]|jgi:hypothetical protein|nr:hypothetical protein [Xanthomonadaceae bacterium]
MSAASDAAEAPPSLKAFLLTAVLWLPLAFFLWFVVRSVVVYLPIKLAGAGLLAWMPDLFDSITQEFANAVVITKFEVPGFEAVADGQLAVISTDVDALMYCYGWPILLALVMATPMTWARTFLQLGIGFVVLVPTQAFGVAGGILRDLSYLAGDPLRIAIEGQGLSQYLIAFWYQTGYLILPPIMPVVAWILMNRRFIESIAGPFREPDAPAGGPKDPAP